jgi:plastocyanin
MQRFALCLALATLIALSACKSNEGAANVTALNKPTVQVDPASAATITGQVKFTGPVPTPQKIDMTQDPSCGTTPNYDESLVVNNGDLQNVFVYVKGGLNGGGGRREEPAVIDQQGCRYHPHVLGVLVGQPIKIVNHDDTTHNIHPMPAASKQWNESQLPNAEPIVKTFTKPEVMVPVKCNQHPWMKMYLNVVDSPYFAVTGPDGKFEITGLPPGEYTLAAVHEKLGEQDVKVTIGPKDSKTASFTFKAQ